MGISGEFDMPMALRYQRIHCNAHSDRHLYVGAALPTMSFKQISKTKIYGLSAWICVMGISSPSTPCALL